MHIADFLDDPDAFQARHSFASICRSYIVEFGETAGFTLAEFDGVLDPRSEVPLDEQDDMLQLIFDFI